MSMLIDRCFPRPKISISSQNKHELRTRGMHEGTRIPRLRYGVTFFNTAAEVWSAAICWRKGGFPETRRVLNLWTSLFRRPQDFNDLQPSAQAFGIVRQIVGCDVHPFE